MKKRPWILMLLLPILLLSGCGDDDDNPMTPAPGAALVRVGHLSADAPAVDVWVDGAVVLSNVPFRAFSEYLSLEAGDHQVQVTPTGASTPIVIDATLTLADGVSYTVAARGLLADGSLAASVYVDDVTPSASQATVRFVHASPDAPAVDITLTDGTILFGSVAFTDSDDGLAVGAGSYDLQVRAAGTSTVVLSFGDVPLSAGTNYTVWAVGLLGDGSLDAIVAVDAPGIGNTVVDLEAATARVRVAHLSPAPTPNVDVWVDGAIVASLTNVPFQAVSGYLTLPAKSTELQVYATGDDSSPVIEATITLLPGEAYTVAATGVLADLQPVVLVDDLVPATSGGHVRFFHASPDAPNVSVNVSGGPTLFTDTAFRAFDGYDPVAAGTYTLEVRPTSDPNTVVLTVPGVTISDGVNYTVFAIGEVGNASLAALAIADTQ